VNRKAKKNIYLEGVKLELKINKSTNREKEKLIK
jgi:hypothetical protein